MTVKVKYVGDGSFFPGVPASDHECAEAEAERLVASGLYAYAKEPKAERSVGAASGAPTARTEEESET